MNFAHGELYMLGAYAGIVVVGLTHSFWLALVVAPLAVGAIGAVTEMTTLRPLYRREPLYGLILTFGLALVFREGARQIWGGDMRRILPPFTGSTPLLGMTYPNYRLFLLARFGAAPGHLALLHQDARRYPRARRRAGCRDAGRPRRQCPAGVHAHLRGLGRPCRAGRPPAGAGVHGLPADGRRDDPPRVHRGDPRRHGIDGRLGRRRVRHRAGPEPSDPLDEPAARGDRDLRDHDRGPDRPPPRILRPGGRS